MKDLILLGFFCWSTVVFVGCSDSSALDVEEGYTPKHKIDFSHSIHAEITETSDCYYCHQTSGEKVKLSLCSSCHQIEKSAFERSDYYEKLEAISSYIRSFKK